MMQTLEDWISQFLSLPISELNKRDADPYKAEQEIEALPAIVGKKPPFNPVPEHLLIQFHEKILGLRDEDKIWGAVLSRLANPLPPHVARDLIDRGVNVTALGHTRQHDEVQWRLASLVDEALLTLARDFYKNPDYDVADLQRLLDQYPDHEWLLSSWPHWGESTKEKQIAFHRWAWEHPKRTDFLLSPEKYLEMLAIREHEAEK